MEDGTTLMPRKRSKVERKKGWVGPQEKMAKSPEPIPVSVGNRGKRGSYNNWGVDNKIKELLL